MASARIEATVTVKGIYEYEAPAYGYGYEIRRIYTMTAEDGTVYVWKTTSVLYEKVSADGCKYCASIDAKGHKWNYNAINRGDIIRIKATYKRESVYNGENQTEITRVAVIDVISRAESPEEIAMRKAAEKAARIQAQRDSLKDGDYLWRMPYKQYKEHYSDCETIADSFESKNGHSTIEVIIRAGRLKASGVRGERFHRYAYIVTTASGERIRAIFRAVCEGNALKQLKKAYPDAIAVEDREVYR